MSTVLKELENLNLTETDFKMITDGLEALPEKGLAGDFMVDMLGAMLLKDDPEAEAKMKFERKLSRDQKEREKKILFEEVRILQGKILMLQRYLRMNNLLKQANDVLDS